MTWTIQSFDILWSKWPLGWSCLVPGADSPDIIVHCHQVRTLHFSPADCSLEVARLADLVDPCTRVVALGGAANSFAVNEIEIVLIK